MGIKSRDILKSWFKRGKYPTESHFSDLIDSFRHKEEKIAINEVSDLATALNSKSDKSIEQTVANHSVELQMLQDAAWGSGGIRLVPEFDGIEDGEELEIKWLEGYNNPETVVYLSHYGLFAAKVGSGAKTSGAERIVGGYTQATYYPVFASESRKDSDYQIVSGSSATIHSTKLYRLTGTDELWLWDSAANQLVRSSKVQKKDLSAELSLVVIDGELHIRSNRAIEDGESVWLMRNGKWSSEKRIRIDKETIESGKVTERKGWRRYMRSNHLNASYGLEMPFAVTLQSKPLHGRELVGGGGPQYWLYKIEMPAHVMVESLAYTDDKNGDGLWLCIRNGKQRKELNLRKFDAEENLMKQSVSMLYGIALFRETQEATGKVYSERVSNIAPYRVEVRNYLYDKKSLHMLIDFSGQGELEGYCRYRVV